MMMSLSARSIDRLIGTVDAIFLGDLFALCGPCRRSVRRALARLRLRLQGLPPLALPLVGSGGVSSLVAAPSPSHAPGSVDASTGPAIPAGPPAQQQPGFSFFGGRRERAGPSFFSARSQSSGGVRDEREEEEAAAAVRLAEQLQRVRVRLCVCVVVVVGGGGGGDRAWWVSSCGVVSLACF